jgi:hypothetical protein
LMMLALVASVGAEVRVLVAGQVGAGVERVLSPLVTPRMVQEARRLRERPVPVGVGRGAGFGGAGLAGVGGDCVVGGWTSVGWSGVCGRLVGLGLVGMPPPVAWA